MRSNCRVKLPAPAVAERNSTISSPISASGIMARTRSHPGQPSRVSKPRIWPRRPDRMALIFAVASVGQTISTTWIGSSSTGWHCGSAFADADPRRGAERQIGGIDAVIGAVGQRHLHIDDGKAERPAQQAVDHALFHRADIVARHRAADDLFVKLEAAAARQRLDLQHHVAELAVAAGLLLVPAALGDRFADGLLIADRRRLRFDVDAEAVAQPLQRDPQMHLALPPQHDVVGLRVVDHRQRGIFLVQPQQGLAELDVVLAVGRRNRHRQHRRRRLDAAPAPAARSCRSTACRRS